MCFDLSDNKWMQRSIPIGPCGIEGIAQTLILLFFWLIENHFMKMGIGNPLHILVVLICLEYCHKQLLWIYLNSCWWHAVIFTTRNVMNWIRCHFAFLDLSIGIITSINENNKSDLQHFGQISMMHVIMPIERSKNAKWHLIRFRTFLVFKMTACHRKFQGLNVSGCDYIYKNSNSYAWHYQPRNIS